MTFLVHLNWGKTLPTELQIPSSDFGGESFQSSPRQTHTHKVTKKLSVNVPAYVRVCVGFPVTLYDSTQMDALEWQSYETPDGSPYSRGVSDSVFYVSLRRNNLMTVNGLRQLYVAV